MRPSERKSHNSLPPSKNRLPPPHHISTSGPTALGIRPAVEVTDPLLTVAVMPTESKLAEPGSP